LKGFCGCAILVLPLSFFLPPHDGWRPDSLNFMNLPRSLKDLAARSLLRSVHRLARHAGAVLLGVQRALEWLDGPHPIATRLKPVTTFLARHPRRLAAAFGGSLLVLAGGAFALASLGPDAAELPVSNHIENVVVPSLQSQAEMLDLHDLKLLRSDTTRSADSAESLLRRLGIVDPEAARFMRTNPLVRDALSRSGRSVSAETTDQQQLTQLTVRWLRSETDSQFQRLSVTRDDKGLSARLETAPMNASIRVSGGTVSSSLFAASDEARLPDTIVNQLTDIFSSQIDFHRTLRKGARFGVVYEVLEADGEPVRAGKVLSAEFVNGDKTYQAVWFQEPGQKGAYYGFDGHSLRRAYLAAPVAYSRKTSGMGMRLHPIFQTVQAHRGIDYAAPTGTPAYTVGDGVVEFAGVQGGYGNMVIVRHGNNHSTVYAHLSRIQVRKGQPVTQGQVVGAVGSTGWSTGPHLHFEFRINGVYTDPQRIIQQAQSAPISPVARAAFLRQAHAARLQLAAASQMRDGNEL
jgi:murein DD-endopeptidase MepM/ murein hydrolase activator NlpD